MAKASAHTPSLALFAPVQRFVLDHSAVRVGTISGYAASQRSVQFVSGSDQAVSGSCAVKLVSDDELFGMTKAWAFSEQAREDGIQDGWAGFAIHGLATAMALSPNVELRCAVSDRVLATIARSDLTGEIAMHRAPHLDVRTLRSTHRAAYGCSDLLHMLPIAERYRDVYGCSAVVEASYRWILRRIGAKTEMHNFISDLKPGWLTLEMWQRMIASDEFQAGTGMPLLGPFEADFPFRA